MKPNFLVIGAAKSGTTSLCHLLARHPDVYVHARKEPNFFAPDDRYRLGIAHYESMFEGAAGVKAIGEGSTTYSITGVYPHAPSRIAEHLPDARFIYIVREPITRIQSHWLQMMHDVQYEPLEFNAAVRTMPYLLDSSLYFKQVTAYRQHFPDDRLLTLFFEDFVASPPETIRRCFDFLGVDPRFEPPDVHAKMNVTAGHTQDTRLLRRLRRVPGLSRLGSSVPASLRRFLKRRLREPLDAVARWDDDTWRWVRDQVEPDAHDFLSYCGVSPGQWRFGSPPPPKER